MTLHNKRAIPSLVSPPHLAQGDRVPKKPHREAFEESNRHLRLRTLLSALAVTLLALWMQVTVAGESLEPGDLLMALIMSAVGGGGAAVLALILGGLVRWQSMPRKACRGASLTVAVAGMLLAVYAILATDAAPRNALGIAEERQTLAYLAGLAATAFGIANRPPRANLG